MNSGSSDCKSHRSSLPQVTCNYINIPVCFHLKFLRGSLRKPARAPRSRVSANAPMIYTKELMGGAGWRGVPTAISHGPPIGSRGVPPTGDLAGSRGISRGYSWDPAAQHVGSRRGYMYTNCGLRTRGVRGRSRVGAHGISRGRPRKHRDIILSRNWDHLCTPTVGKQTVADGLKLWFGTPRALAWAPADEKPTTTQFTARAASYCVSYFDNYRYGNRDN